MAKFSEVGKVYKKEKEPFFWTRVCLSLFFFALAIGLATTN